MDNQTPDWRLLRRYVEQHSQEAFAVLVARHLNMVYATCRREVGDAGTAEDVTQVVFLILARKAPSIRPGVPLAGWLFQTARFAAKNARTQEIRRQRYEQEAARMNVANQNQHDHASWDALEPCLNDAVARLPARDREAILLRYWSDRSLAETGAALGVSEEAARKRVSRALEKLRGHFAKQGVVVPSAALAILLSRHATKAAPLLAPAVASTAHHAFTGTVTPDLIGNSAHAIWIGTLHAMKIAQIKTATGIIVVAIAGVVGVAAAGVVTTSHHKIRAAGHSASFIIQQGKHTTLAISGKGLKIKQIVQNSREAYDKLQSYQVTVTVTAHALMGSPSKESVYHTTANIQFVRPGKIRADGRTMTGGPYAFVSDGNGTFLSLPTLTTGWTPLPDAKNAVQALAGVSQGATTSIPSILIPFEGGSPLSLSLSYGPTAKEAVLDGNSCYIVTTAPGVTPQKSVTYTLWIDTKTFRLRELETNISANVMGTWLKSHMSQVYTNEIVDAPIPDSAFRKPAGQ